ncbi:MAG: DMT family transporter [Coriobacteriia bacterium]|nr:DMT family transporter [Coriobacteriia bacterium]
MNTLQANICLLAVTLCWSFEVIIHAVIPEGVNPFATTCVTSLIAALLLGGYFFKRIAIAIQSQRSLFLRRILLLSVLNAAYNVLYLEGLEYFDVSTGAFTASMTVVIIPVLLLAMRRDTSVRTWISAFIVLAGIVIAVIPSITEMHDVRGVGVMAAGCLVRAVFIVKLNDFAREHDPVTLSTGMLGLAALFAFIPWVCMEPATFFALPWNTELIAAYFVYAYFIVAFATVLNVYAQRRASAAHATVIYSTEIVFSTIWAAVLPSGIIDSVAITPPVVIGCLLVVLGNLVEIMQREPWKESKPAGDEVAAVMIRTSHPFATLLNRLKSRAMRNVLLFIGLVAIYLVIALPFKVLLVIPGFADIRPVCMLMPAYGIFFGIPGCLASATGNLICDALSDSLRWSSIAGFIGNFVYPFLLYLIWTKLRKEHFHLRTPYMIAMTVLSFAFCAIVLASIITPAVAHFYHEVDVVKFALTVIGNTLAFPTGLAIPFIILIQEELGYKPISRHHDVEVRLEEAGEK